MQNIAEFGAEFLKGLHKNQQQALISKKIIEADTLTTKKFSEFENKTTDLENFADDFYKIQSQINNNVTSDIKDSFIKNKVLGYLTENANKIHKQNYIKSKKEQIYQLNNSINDQLTDLQKLARYGEKNIDELIKMADFTVSNNILPEYQLKNIKEKAFEGITKNYFEGLLSKDLNKAKEFLSSSIAKKYIKEGFLAETNLKEQVKLNKIKADVIKNTKLDGLKQRIKEGYSVESQEIYELQPYIGEAQTEILQKENDFMQTLRKMNKDELENFKEKVDKNKIPQIDNWIKTLDTGLKNNPLKTADRLNVIKLENLNFENQNSIKKREEDIKIIQNHYNLNEIDPLLTEEREKIEEFLNNSTSLDALAFGKNLHQNGESILGGISKSFLQTIKYADAGYTNAENNAIKILEGEKLSKTLQEKPFKTLKQTLDMVVGDSFILNNEFTEPLNERIKNYLISDLKTTRGGIFFGNKTFEIPDATEKEVRNAIKAVTGSEIGELNGSFFLTPSGFSEKDTKKHLKSLKTVKNNDQELAYWNNRKIYPVDILKYGNLKMIDNNQYLIYMRGNNSDFLRIDGGGYFVMGF